MDCRGIGESVSAWVDGEASPGEARRVEEHLAACPSCSARAEAMKALDARLSRDVGDASPGFRRAVVSRLDREGLLPRRRVKVPSLRWALPLAAAAAALAALVVREAGRPPGEVPSGGPAVASRPAARPGSVPPAGPADLSAEEREIVAILEILEDPDFPAGWEDLDDPGPAGPAGEVRG